MSTKPKLSARRRSESGGNAVKAVRARGAVPAVIYSHKATPRNLEIDRRSIETLLSHSVGEQMIVELEIEDAGKTSSFLSLIQEVQHHPVRGEILHVDFHAVSADEEVEAEVVLEPEGDAVGVKTYGGLLQQNLHSISVRCLPQNLPELIRVDVTNLNLGEAIHIKDVVLPTGVVATGEPDVTVFLVSEPRVSTAEDTSGDAASEPEVIKEKQAEASS